MFDILVQDVEFQQKAINIITKLAQKDSNFAESALNAFGIDDIAGLLVTHIKDMSQKSEQELTDEQKTLINIIGHSHNANKVRWQQMLKNAIKEKIVEFGEEHDLYLLPYMKPYDDFYSGFLLFAEEASISVKQSLIYIAYCTMVSNDEPILDNLSPDQSKFCQRLYSLINQEEDIKQVLDRYHDILVKDKEEYGQDDHEALQNLDNAMRKFMDNYKKQYEVDLYKITNFTGFSREISRLRSPNTSISDIDVKQDRVMLRI